MTIECPKCKTLYSLIVEDGIAKCGLCDTNFRLVDEQEPKAIKVSDTPEYGMIFTLNLPVKFFFNKDGSFDGIEVSVKDASPAELNLIVELCGCMRLKP